MDDEPAGSAGDSLTLDEMLDLLADHRCRCLLDYLHGESGSIVPLDDAANYVANRIAEETGKRPNEEDLEVQFQHHHLPKLAEKGIVDYDARTGDIRYHGNERLEAFYEHVRAFEPE